MAPTICVAVLFPTVVLLNNVPGRLDGRTRLQFSATRSAHNLNDVFSLEYRQLVDKKTAPYRFTAFWSLTDTFGLSATENPKKVENNAQPADDWN